jgi:energy-coupling factor transporter ATP-binding protein EcfA2
MTGWLLQRIEIEGMRGINNEGDPLVIKFKDNCITSISAPNGVGKSSIFDAVSFAIRGTIPKLDELPAAEHGKDYYVNRFHGLGRGQVKLTLAPDGGGAAVTITVTCDGNGTRVVGGPNNAAAILREIDREFVLLDNVTFQSFVNTKDLDRGRAFSGLLGLKQYSEARQTLQGLVRTQPFNNHFDLAALDQRRRGAASNLTKVQRAAQTAFEALTKKKLSEFPERTAAVEAAHNALAQVELLKGHCVGKAFAEIDFQACLDVIAGAEHGDERAELSGVVAEQTALENLLQADTFSAADKDDLRALAASRDIALQEIGSELLHQHLHAAHDVLSSDGWPDKCLCPTCNTLNDASVLDKVVGALSRYDAVQQLASEIEQFWQTHGVDNVINLEAKAQTAGEPRPLHDMAHRLRNLSLSGAQVDELWASRETYRAKLQAAINNHRSRRTELEAKLPPSYVAINSAVGAAKSLAENWASATEAESEIATIDAEKGRIEQIRRFLDTASTRFQRLESATTDRRVIAVQPICRNLFKSIVFADVEPSLVKPQGAETLALSLSRFFGLADLSAQALLSESFRNALAVSVYLAAAQLYGAGSRFIILDDVTSSFDAGHQFMMMQIIKSNFARPGNPAGPQVIILSHDTLLEKLFNKNGNGTDWQHIRLEGTAQTAILPHTADSTQLRDKTVALLSAGQVQDGALRLRFYLEQRLLEIIGKLKIPVPIDFAMDDNRKQVQNCIDAINAMVNLTRAAGTIALTTQQQQGLGTHVATITGNYLSHYATGQTQAFSAPALLAVVNAIDQYAQCFQHEDPPGSGRMVWYRSLSR